MNNIIKFAKNKVTYTREELIDSGSLIDITSYALEVGIKWPLAVTFNVWEKYIINDDIENHIYQTQACKIWGIVNKLRSAISRLNYETNEILFVAHIIPSNKQYTSFHRTLLKAVVNTGDYFEPVITVMLPDED
jgi:hypothetical protein